MWSVLFPKKSANESADQILRSVLNEVILVGPNLCGPEKATSRWKRIHSPTRASKENIRQKLSCANNQLYRHLELLFNRNSQEESEGNADNSLSASIATLAAVSELSFDSPDALLTTLVENLEFLEDVNIRNMVDALSHLLIKIPYLPLFMSSCMVERNTNTESPTSQTQQDEGRFSTTPIDTIDTQEVSSVIFPTTPEQSPKSNISSAFSNFISKYTRALSSPPVTESPKVEVEKPEVVVEEQPTENVTNDSKDSQVKKPAQEVRPVVSFLLRNAAIEKETVCFGAGLAFVLACLHQEDAAAMWARKFIRNMANETQNGTEADNEDLLLAVKALVVEGNLPLVLLSNDQVLQKDYLSLGDVIQTMRAILKIPSVMNQYFGVHASSFFDRLMSLCNAKIYSFHIRLTALRFIFEIISNRDYIVALSYFASNGNYIADVVSCLADPNSSVQLITCQILKFLKDKPRNNPVFNDALRQQRNLILLNMMSFKRQMPSQYCFAIESVINIVKEL